MPAGTKVLPGSAAVGIVGSVPEPGSLVLAGIASLSLAGIGL